MNDLKQVLSNYLGVSVNEIRLHDRKFVLDRTGQEYVLITNDNANFVMSRIILKNKDKFKNPDYLIKKMKNNPLRGKIIALYDGIERQIDDLFLYRLK